MPVARQQSSWWLCGAAAVLILASGAALRRQPVALAPPSFTPGLSEWIAIEVARLAHALPIGTAVLRANDAALGIGLALFLVLARWIGIAWIAALPAALALTLSATFDPTLAPLQTLELVAAAASFLALIQSARAPTVRTGAQAAVALLVTALIAPSTVLWLSAIAAWVVARALVESNPMRRVSLSILTVALVIAVVAAFALVVPRLPPSTEVGAASGWWAHTLGESWSVKGAWDGAGTVVADAGPLILALAVFGAFSRRHSIAQRRWWPLWCFALVPFVPAGALLGVWLLAALGLHEIMQGARATRRGRVFIVLLVVLVPVLKIVRPPRLVPDESQPRGHARVSLDQMRRLVAALPDGAVLVRADAMEDLLLRALDGTWQRMGKSLRTASAHDVMALVASDNAASPVFALPAAQSEVQAFGVRQVDVDLGGTSALARLRPGGACTQLDATWRDLRELTTTQSFSLVSQERPWDGPVIVYTEHEGRLDAGPHAWPGATARGFTATRYVRGAAGDRALLDRVSADDRVPLSDRLDADDVVRFELWHAPEAPDILVVDLSDRPARALARLGQAATSQRVAICPVFPHTPRGF